MEYLQPGQTLGHYRLIRQVGSGSFARVWLAERRASTGFSRRVALKILKRAEEASASTSFLEEAALMARLHHPHIVDVHDVQSVDGVWCVEMEFLGGGSLADLVDAAHLAGRAIPLAACVEILRSILEALGHAHGFRDDAGVLRPVIHRDLKPANVLVSRAGVVKVADFGLAKVLGDATATATGLVKGTPAYISPEVWRGTRDFRPRVDLFALGCILYELLLGRRLFAGDSIPSIYGQIREGEAGSEAIAIAGVCKPLVPVLERLIRRDPAQRYQAASDVLMDLNRFGLLATGTELQSFMTQLDVETPAPPGNSPIPLEETKTITSGSAATSSSARRDPERRGLKAGPNPTPVLVDVLGGDSLILKLEVTQTASRLVKELASLLSREGEDLAKWRVYAPDGGGAFGPLNLHDSFAVAASWAAQTKADATGVGFAGPGVHQGRTYHFRIRVMAPSLRKAPAAPTKPVPLLSEDAIDLSGIGGSSVVVLRPARSGGGRTSTGPPVSRTVVAAVTAALLLVVVAVGWVGWGAVEREAVVESPLSTLVTSAAGPEDLPPSPRPVSSAAASLAGEPDRRGAEGQLEVRSPMGASRPTARLAAPARIDSPPPAQTPEASAEFGALQDPQSPSGSDEAPELAGQAHSEGPNEPARSPETTPTGELSAPVPLRSDGCLLLASRPPGGFVWIDNKKSGTRARSTPQNGVHLRPGRHEVQMGLGGSPTVSISVPVISGGASLITWVQIPIGHVRLMPPPSRRGLCSAGLSA